MSDDPIERSPADRTDEPKPLELADVIGRLPLVEPDSDWLAASKRRLLARFEELNQQRRERERGDAIMTGAPRIVEQWQDAWNSHDVERILACLSEDAVYEDVPTGRINRTHEEARQFIEAGWAAFPDLRFEYAAASVTGEHGTSEWTMMGTHWGDFPGLPATGKAFSVRGVSVLELSGDKIRTVRDYWDFATVLRQLGVLTEPATS
jgi:steroid delta-isomerase-like uncharacterized protein